jgi:hypothetical protein
MDRILFFGMNFWVDDVVLAVHVRILKIKGYL